MRQESLTKISECRFCDKKAEWLYISIGLIHSKTFLLCNNHRMAIYDKTFKI